MLSAAAVSRAGIKQALQVGGPLQQRGLTAAGVTLGELLKQKLQEGLTAGQQRADPLLRAKEEAFEPLAPSSPAARGAEATSWDPYGSGDPPFPEDPAHREESVGVQDAFFYDEPQLNSFCGLPASSSSNSALVAEAEQAALLRKAELEKRAPPTPVTLADLAKAGKRSSGNTSAPGSSKIPDLLRKVRADESAAAAANPARQQSAFLRMVKEEVFASDASAEAPSNSGVGELTGMPESSAMHGTFGDTQDDDWQGMPVEEPEQAEGRSMVTPFTPPPTTYVPTGKKLVKLRTHWWPANVSIPGARAPETPGVPKPVKKEEMSAKFTQLGLNVSGPAMKKGEKKAWEIEREQKREQASLRDVACRAICRIKRGVRQPGAQMDGLPFIPCDWATTFEPRLGKYKTFLRSRPDQFRIDEPPGAPQGVWTIIDISGGKMVDAAERGQWRNRQPGKSSSKGHGKGKKSAAMPALGGPKGGSSSKPAQQRHSDGRVSWDDMRRQRGWGQGTWSEESEKGPKPVPFWAAQLTKPLPELQPVGSLQAPERPPMNGVGVTSHGGSSSNTGDGACHAGAELGKETESLAAKSPAVDAVVTPASPEDEEVDGDPEELGFFIDTRGDRPSPAAAAPSPEAADGSDDDEPCPFVEDTVGDLSILQKPSPAGATPPSSFNVWSLLGGDAPSSSAGCKRPSPPDAPSSAAKRASF